MTQVVAPGADSLLLHDISWSTYDAFARDLARRAGPRVSYDRGALEIVSPHAPHERLARLVSELVVELCTASGQDVEDLGHLTFRNDAWRQGFEPDGCWWIGDRARLGRALAGAYRPGEHPPPDLLLEVDDTSPSLSKTGMFARFGIPEVWRHDTQRLHVLRLVGDRFEAVDRSLALPGLRASDIDGSAGRRAAGAAAAVAGEGATGGRCRRLRPRRRSRLNRPGPAWRGSVGRGRSAEQHDAEDDLDDDSRATRRSVRGRTGG